MRQRITPSAQPMSRFDSLRPNTLDAVEASNAETEEGFGFIVAYSTFHPCSTRPLSFPLCSGMVTPMPTVLESTSQKNDMKETMKDSKREKEEGVEEVAFKPWPYSLPSWLRPKASTTFSLMSDRTLPISAVVDSERTGVLQFILYGVPNPERFSYSQELVAPGSLLHKVLHGIKEMDECEGTVASVTVVESENVDLGEEKIKKEEDEAIVVKGMQSKVTVEDVLEKNNHMGHGMIAKQRLAPSQNLTYDKHSACK